MATQDHDDRRAGAVALSTQPFSLQLPAGSGFAKGAGRRNIARPRSPCIDKRTGPLRWGGPSEAVIGLIGRKACQTRHASPVTRSW